MLALIGNILQRKTLKHSILPIGFSNSPWLQRWLRRYGWID